MVRKSRAQTLLRPSQAISWEDSCLLGLLAWPEDVIERTNLFQAALALDPSQGADVSVTTKFERWPGNPAAIEARGTVSRGGAVLADVFSGGPDMDLALENARFLAVRQALFGKRAMCGTLLDNDRVIVRLLPKSYKERNHYLLDIAFKRPVRSLPDRLQMGAALHPRQKNHRTRYMRVRKAPREFVEWLEGQMNVDPILLHRLILLLDGADMSDGNRHGHHINHCGFDNRRENLVATLDHQEFHSDWSDQYGSPRQLPAGRAIVVVRSFDTSTGQAVLLANGRNTHGQPLYGHRWRLRLLDVGHPKRRRHLESLVIGLPFRASNVKIARLPRQLCPGVSSRQGIHDVLEDAVDRGLLEVLQETTWRVRLLVKVVRMLRINRPFRTDWVLRTVRTAMRTRMAWKRCSVGRPPFQGTKFIRVAYLQACEARQPDRW